eukprot:TRINITY_DN41866_c0_g1_i1.p1 TRINITY_DN41866_c0_g1~~TRINITY_DN41866_c0_g1_i1.p1  ORF type:complete len:413 (+),score=45.87 TRINITY_DN41866_c0_g1_i1:69-1307(+)
MDGLDAGTLVLDIGSDTVRIGFGGDREPCLVSSPLTALSRLDEDDVGFDAESLGNFLNYRGSGLGAAKVQLNRGAVEASIALALSFGTSSSSKTPSRLLVSEPNVCALNFREAIAQMVFERPDAPSCVAFKPSAVLDIFGAGRSSGVVVDLGAGVSTVASVCEGEVFGTAIREHPFSGSCLDAAVVEALRNQGVEVPPDPQLEDAFKRCDEKCYDGKEPPRKQRRRLFNGFSLSILRRAQDLKETMCFCSHLPVADLPPSDKPFRHVLPDGKKIDVSAFSRDVPEALLIGSGPCDGLDIFLCEAASKPFYGIPWMLNEVLLDMQMAGQGIKAPEAILFGGSARFVNFQDRLQSAVDQFSSIPSTKIDTSMLSVDRRHAAWIGGSIAAGVEGASSRWVSKNDFKEHGPRIFAY